MKKITVDYLKKIEACKEGIKFFQSGNFEKLDWENFELKKNIIGDYNYFASWLKNDLIKIKKYDKRNNLIYSKDKNGFWKKYKYDKRNNLIYSENRNGFWEKFKYDKRNNLIYSKDKKGIKINREFIYNAEDILTKIKENDKTIFEIEF